MTTSSGNSTAGSDRSTTATFSPPPKTAARIFPPPNNDRRLRAGPRIGPLDPLLGRLRHDHSAGDVDRLACHLARVVGRQERDQARHMMRLLEPAHRDSGHPALLDALFGLAGHGLFP